jgi:hypothetical protein
MDGPPPAAWQANLQNSNTIGQKNARSGQRSPFLRGTKTRQKHNRTA